MCSPIYLRLLSLEMRSGPTFLAARSVNVLFGKIVTDVRRHSDSTAKIFNEIIYISFASKWGNSGQGITHITAWG